MYRTTERPDDERRAQQPCYGFGNVKFNSPEHDGGQGADRPEGAMLQIAIGIQRAAFHQQQRETAHEHGPGTEAKGDDDEIVGHGEGADHAVEREAGVEHFQVEEAGGALLDHLGVSGFLVAAEQGRQALDQDEHHHAPDAEFALPGRVAERPRRRQHYEQGQRRLDRFQLAQP